MHCRLTKILSYIKARNLRPLKRNGVLDIVTLPSMLQPLKGLILVSPNSGERESYPWAICWQGSASILDAVEL